MYCKNMCFLFYTYYTHPLYRTSICGKNRAYYFGIFTVLSDGGFLFPVVCYFIECLYYGGCHNESIILKGYSVDAK